MKVRSTFARNKLDLHFFLIPRVSDKQLYRIYRTAHLDFIYVTQPFSQYTTVVPRERPYAYVELL